jgi:phosphoribosyl 1,2-cyclic phosphate phosphodiesterase
MKMIIMGSGTSHGVPVIGCSCKVCKSSDPHDKRYRASAFVESPANIVIDTGPEFRLQALRAGIENIDAVLITHAHADHIFGLDDLRIFSHTKAKDDFNPNNHETEGEGLPIYVNQVNNGIIHETFGYIFTPTKEGGGKPKLNLINNEQFSPSSPLKIKGMEIVPVPILHGSLPVSGYLLSEIRNGEKYTIAYLTDLNQIEDSSVDIIKSCSGHLEHLVVDALRDRPHSTHFCFDQALELGERLGARHTWFTHMTHNFSHKEIHEYIQQKLHLYPNLEKIVAAGGSVEPAYDQLEIEA